MTGFATQYYDEDGSLTEISTILPLSPTITIGKKTVQMEVTHLSQIFSTYVEKDSSAHWICLHDDDGTNYWFISDNEMGAGLCLRFAISRDGIHKEYCEYNGTSQCLSLWRSIVKCHSRGFS